MGPSNSILAQIAQGADPRMSDAMARGYQQGNAMLTMQQAQQTRNALAQASSYLANDDLKGAQSVLAGAGQFEPAYKIYADRNAAEIARMEARKPQSAIAKLRRDFELGNINEQELIMGYEGIRMGKMPPFISVPQGGEIYSTSQFSGAGQGAPAQAAGPQPLVSRPPKPANLSATDKKAILEADAAIQSYEGVLNSLKSILTPGPDGTSLNDRAGSGDMAQWQAWAARNDPIGFFDDKKGEATTELTNVVLGQALQSLKAIFGGMPTEGERKVLLDLQAAADKTPNERKIILDRAIKQAEISLAKRRQQAQALREGSYFDPQGATAPQSAAGTGNTSDEQAAINAARAAIQQGRDPAMVRQRLEQNGIDPSVLDY